MIQELSDIRDTLRAVGLCMTERQLEGVQSEMTRQGSQLQEVKSQLDTAKQSLEESMTCLTASQKSAEYVMLSGTLQSAKSTAPAISEKDLLGVMLFLL